MRLSRLKILLLLGLGTASPLRAEEVLIPTDKVQGQGDGNFFLLTVGVAQFADDFWPSLKYSSTDSLAVAKALGQGTELKLQTTTLVNQKATRDAMVDELQKIAKRATPRDTVVVYVSSHGTLAESESGELEKVVVLYDTDKEKLGKTGMPHRRLVEWLEGLPARRKLLIFATCHSGVGKSKLSPRIERMLSSAKGRLAPLAEVSEGALILAAAAKGEAAREDDKLGGDIYTHFLLEGLKVYDRNHDGVVTALEAHDYAKEKTYAYTQGRQRPTADARLIGDADVPLRGTRQRSGVPVLEAYDEDLAGFEVQVEGQTKGKLPMAFPLEPGTNRVSLYAPESGRKLATYEVAAYTGEVVTLEEMLAPPPVELKVSGGSERWLDSAFERLGGSPTKSYRAASGYYHWRDWFAGGSIRLRQKGEQGDVRSGLDSELFYQAWTFGGGYEYSIRQMWHLSAELGLGRETMSITFDDGPNEAEFASSATIFAAKVSASGELGAGLRLSLDGGRIAGKHKFDELGDLNADRGYYGLGLSYLFGGVGRRTSW